MSVSLPQPLMTGIQGIDDQHRALIQWARTVNSLDAAIDDVTMLQRAAQFLISYARFHFESEEYAMATTGYQDIERHRKEHGMLRRQLTIMSHTIGNESYGCDITTICAMQRLIREWIQGHIRASDLAFASYCERNPDVRDVQLPSPEDLRRAGVTIDDIEQVEAVHNAGDITTEELPSRLF